MGGYGLNVVETEKRAGPDGECHLRLLEPYTAFIYVCGLYVESGDVPLPDEERVTCTGCLRAFGKREERQPVETRG